MNTQTVLSRGRLRSAVLFLILGALGTRAADQPCWGYDEGRNMVSDETGLPVAFDPDSGQGIKWSVPLGTSTYATPVIAGGRVLIGTNNQVPRDPRHQGDRGVLLCLDEADGTLHWQLVVPKITTSRFWDWPRAGLCSPATVDGDRVYVVSSRGEVLCLDLQGLANGNDGPFQDEARHATPAGEALVELGPLDADILWRYDMVETLGVRQHDSAHGSIVVDGPFLYVNTSNGVDDSHKIIESPEAPSLVVIDKRTGQLAATDHERIGPRIFHCTWSSPSIGTVGSQRLVFFGGGDGVLYAFRALDAATHQPGDDAVALQKVWSFDGDPDSPKEDVSTYLRNRQTSPSNIKSMPVFHQGQVFLTLGGDYWWGKREAWLMCIGAAPDGAASAPRLQWSHPLERHVMATPAVRDGLVYAADCGKQLSCVEQQSGKVVWTYSTRGEIWASPLVADGHVYVVTQRGELVTLAAGRELKELGITELGGSISASPMAANGVLYVATPKTLYAIAK